VEKIIGCWGSGSWRDVSSAQSPHEASLLSISIDKAYHLLKWFPRMDFDETICLTVDWYKCLIEYPAHIREFTLNQIRQYQENSQFVENPAEKVMLS
jgi:CDP-glucose 4,6-dehydratase